jgi:hypothetical protein
MTTADTSVSEVFAEAIGKNLADQQAAGVNVETDRRCGMFHVLRPAFDDIGVIRSTWPRSGPPEMAMSSACSPARCSIFALAASSFAR